LAWPSRVRLNRIPIATSHENIVELYGAAMTCTPFLASVMTAPGNEVTCPTCGEVQFSGDFLCARCGASLETKEQRHERRANLEQSRREAERNDVSIQRFPGFGTNGTSSAKWGTRQYCNQMSNQLRRRYVVVVVFIAICFVFLLTR